MKLVWIFLLCLLAIAVVSAQKGPKKSRDRDDSDSDSDEDDNEKWNKYKQTNKKGYKNPEEEAKRRNEFKKNDDKFKLHNEKQKSGQVHYKMGHNKFSDRNDADLERKFLHEFTQPDLTKVTTQKPASSYPPGPDSISYRTSTLPVLNQGECGCCWAFSAVAQVEAQLKRKDPTYSTRISPQYLLDCSPNAGCT
jgi:C1A family cysteine protease